jgi:hypothetical protein
MLVYFIAIRSIYISAITYILWPFGIFCGILVSFPRFGILCQEKSGNPALESFYDVCGEIHFAKVLLVRHDIKPFKNSFSIFVEKVDFGLNCVAVSKINIEEILAAIFSLRDRWKDNPAGRFNKKLQLITYLGVKWAESCFYLYVFEFSVPKREWINFLSFLWLTSTTINWIGSIWVQKTEKGPANSPTAIQIKNFIFFRRILFESSGLTTSFVSHFFGVKKDGGKDGWSDLGISKQREEEEEDDFFWLF